MLDLLLLSDCYNIASLTAKCAQIIANMAHRFGPSQALKILSVSAAVSGLPEMASTTARARATIRRYPSWALTGNYHGKDFLQITEPDLAILLGSNTLEVESEDQALSAGLVWVEANSDSPRENVESLARAILPHIRFRYLSPSACVELLEKLEGQLKLLSSLPDAPFQNRNVFIPPQERDGMSSFLSWKRGRETRRRLTAQGQT